MMSPWVGLASNPLSRNLKQTSHASYSAEKKEERNKEIITTEPCKIFPFTRTLKWSQLTEKAGQNELSPLNVIAHTFRGQEQKCHGKSDIYEVCETVNK